jgi:hypothetical protein
MIKKLIIFNAILLIIAGCESQTQKPGSGFGGFTREPERPLSKCKGSTTAAEAIAKLEKVENKALPIMASGQCLFEYWAKGKKHKENFPVKIWVNPSYEIYMQGDVAFDAKGLVFGSNEREFWLAMKPNEIKGYWWGEWEEQSAASGINPRTVLEAIGIIRMDEGKWSFTKQDTFDVLTRSIGGQKVQKIYVYNCDQRIYKIEYFDKAGQIAVVTEPSKYKEIVNGFCVPSVIRITGHGDGQPKEMFRISLDKVKLVVFTEEQKNRLFSRPGPRGFKEVYKIVDNKAIKEE